MKRPSDETAHLYWDTLGIPDPHPEEDYEVKAGYFCVTWTGRMDMHLYYVESKDGDLICSFCKRR